MSEKIDGLMAASDVPTVGQRIVLLNGLSARVTAVEHTVVTVEDQFGTVLRMRVVEP